MSDKDLELYNKSQEQEEQSLLSNFSVRDIYETSFRHKKLILFCALAGIAAAVVIGFAQQEHYLSEAKLLVRFVRENVQMDPSSNLNSVISAHSWENTINSEMELLTSRELVEKIVSEQKEQRSSATRSIPRSIDPKRVEPGDVVTELARNVSSFVSALRTGSINRNENLSAQERKILNITSGLEIKVPRYQNILHVGFKHADPQYAQQVLDRLVDLYLQKHMEVHRVSGAYEFFLEQTLKLEQEIEEKQELLRHLKNKYQIASIEDQNRGMSERLGALNKELKQRSSALAASTARLGVLENTILDLQAQLKDDPMSSQRLNAFADQTYDHLIKLQLQEQDLLTNYTDDSMPVKKIREKIGAIRGILEKGMEENERPPVEVSSANEAYNLIFLALLEEQQTQSALKAELESLKKQEKESAKEVAFLNDGEMTILQMQSEVNLLRANHKKYFELAEQARIDNAKESEKIANISIIQPATLPLTPVKSDTVRYMAFAVVFGLMAGFGGAFLSDKVLDHSLKTPEDVENSLHVETLASIPYLRSKSLHLLPKEEQEVGTDNPEEKNLLWDLPPQIKDHYGTLSERLLAEHPNAKEEPVIIGVTSWGRREGVSTVAANLAVSLAERDGQVLLVDANLQNPKAKNFFGRRASGGLSVINADGLGRTTVLQHNLFLLPAGEMENKTQSESMPQKRCDDIISQLQRLEGGYVVIDMPPLNESATAVRFARLAHTILLVVEAEKNRREAVARGRDMLKRVHANLEGVILNKRRYHIPSWIYQRI